jgi:hypothetical protein
MSSLRHAGRADAGDPRLLGSNARANDTAPLEAAPPLTAPPQTLQSADVSSLQSTDLGMQAYFLGHWPAAVDLLRSVPAEGRSPLQWLHLARALVKLGNLVEAWDSYNELEDMAVPGLSAEGWQASLEVSQVEAAAVKERIP